MQKAGQRAARGSLQGGEVPFDSPSTVWEAGLQEFWDPFRLTDLCDLVNHKVLTILGISTL